MSAYYAYLNNVDKNKIVDVDYWNGLIGDGQSTDDLLFGSVTPYALATASSFYLYRSPTAQHIRYYTSWGTFQNSNNQNCIETSTVTQASQSFVAHKMLLPGFYAWNITWGEDWSATSGDQVYGVRVRRITQTQVNALTSIDNAEIIGEHRSISTSWAYTTATQRYGTYSTSFGMGFPMHTYSGMHFFNAPPYGTEYEYVIFEFLSSHISPTSISTKYWNRFQPPSVTLMKVR
jgi:hypothetical protein